MMCSMRSFKGCRAVVNMADGSSLVGTIRKVDRRVIILESVAITGAGQVAGVMVCERVNVLFWQVIEGST